MDLVDPIRYSWTLLGTWVMMHQVKVLELPWGAPVGGWQ